MCLENIGEKKKATKNIICYKILYALKTEFLTPYRSMRIQLGEEYSSVLIVRGEFDAVVEEGFHSFEEPPHLQCFRGLTLCYPIVIAKCIIPKGASYYEGSFRGLPCYASNKIKYLELLNEKLCV
jgi:hypothetical protein